jgi:tetratricopeptide (TPR) repeat protein
MVAMVSLAQVTCMMAGEADPPAAAGNHHIAKPDPPPNRQPLKTDAAFQVWFDKFMAAEPAKDAPGHDEWLRHAPNYANYNRDYSQAEIFVRALLEKKPDDWALHDDLSIMLGKQGKYQEALDEVQKALGMPGANELYLKAVMASWIYHLGRRDEAKALFAALEIPAETSQEWASYQGCRACFSASSHDIRALKESIGIIMRLGGQHQLFIMRDVIFDQYRHLDWFCALVGDTLAQVQ